MAVPYNDSDCEDDDDGDDDEEDDNEIIIEECIIENIDEDVHESF